LDNTTTDYRTCFGTDAGHRVLGHLLLEAGYFDTDLSTEGEIAVRNFAQKIVCNLGLFNMKEGKIVGIDSYINGLFGVEYD
jgi:hypothetical protein